MSEREHRQAERQRIPLIISPAEREYDQAKDQAMRAVKFTVCRGYVHPDETKEFNAMFRRLWDGEITSREWEVWVRKTNAIAGLDVGSFKVSESESDHVKSVSEGIA